MSCPGGVDAVIDPSTWEAPRIFEELARIGSVERDEMRQVFNLGIGMVVVVPPDAAHRAVDTLRLAGQRARVIGEVGCRRRRRPLHRLTGRAATLTGRQIRGTPDRRRSRHRPTDEGAR